MKIPTGAILLEDKLTRYLLTPKARNDQPKFLAKAGFTQQNPEALRVEDRTNEYGTFYGVEGELMGTNGVDLSVVLNLATTVKRWEISVCHP